jgi:transcriptional regulator NrdR family protein
VTTVAEPKDKPGERNKRGGGMECPLCECPETYVVWTRDRVLKIDGKPQGFIVRARQCCNDQCRYRFQTEERITEDSKPPEKRSK